MNRQHAKVILVTGASSGIGRACAVHLYSLGHRVYGTSRRPTIDGVPFCALQMDVDEDESVQRGVDHILSQEGRLDVVINSAGFGYVGAVEDTSIAEAKAQLETNFFGTLRVCRAVLPTMRAQASGTIINISSMAGLIAIPFQALYSASKSAVEGLTESLSMEVRSYGIRVVLIEPGDFCTGFTSHRRRTEQSRLNAAYAATMERAVAVMEHDELHGGPPDAVARCVARILASRAPRLRYAVGPLTERVAVHLKKILPGRLFEWLIMKYYRVI